MNIKRIVLTALACIVFSISVVAQDQPGTSVWQSFRQKYPYHAQFISMSPQAADGSRILIVAEPPPHVTIESFKSLSPVLRDAVVMKHPIGHDGWVKDIVVALPDMTPDQTKALVTQLNGYLFSTSYKASFLEFSPDKTKPLRAAPMKTNLEVPVSDLRAIALGSNEFLPLYGGPYESLGKVLSHKQTGVYFSRNPGLVVWVVSRKADLSDFRAEARQFCLDSDLLLGAVGTGDIIAIVGRERVIPQAILPPLRTETLLLLAAVNGDEISQSYERNNFAAGKFDEAKNLDWAPIYLSDALVDTEYGSLLNITDQLLKGWSLNGTVKYENFTYPQPSAWPFPKPLDKLVGVSSLTFNWNTKGAAYGTEGKEMILALNRTGALPVSYLAEGEGDSAEAQEALGDKEVQAYDYFANLRDPNLARVVQYAAFYQIMRRFNIKSRVEGTSAQINHDPLSAEFRKILEMFMSLDAKTLDAKFDAMNAEDFSAIDFLTALQQADHIEELRNSLVTIRNKDGEKGLDRIAEHLSGPREHINQEISLYTKVMDIVKAQPRAQQEKTYEELTSAKHIVNHLNDTTLKSPFDTFSEAELDELAIDLTAREISTHKELIRFLTATSIRSLKDGYEKAMERPESGWIHTPSLVVSSPGKEKESTGGHSIDAHVTQFRVDNTIQAGQIRIIEENKRKIVLYSVHDEDIVPQIAEIVGRVNPAVPARDIERVINANMSSIVKPPPRPRNAVLGFSQTSKPSEDRGLQVPQNGSPALLGYKTTVRSQTQARGQFVAALSSTGSSGTVVERLSPSSIFISHGSTGHVVEATDTASAMEALRGIAMMDSNNGLKTRLVFRKGFTENEVIGYTDSLRVKLAGEIEGGVEVEPLSGEQISRIVGDTDLDYSAARITEETMSEEGVDLVKQPLTVDVPSKVTARPSLRLRITLFFERSLGSIQAKVAEAKDIIASTLRNFGSSGGNDPVITAASQLRSQLVKRFGVEAVRVHILDQAADFLITERISGHEHSDRDRKAA